MAKIKIDFSELELAFDSARQGISSYLDTETGKIIMINEDDQFVLDSIRENYADDETGKIDWEAAFEGESIPDWQKEILQEEDQVELEPVGHFKEIPGNTSQDGYLDMQDFIATVKDKRLQAYLEGAISGKGAFRNFKAGLDNYPAERERWFKFENDRLRQRVIDSLESEEITYEIQEN